MGAKNAIGANVKREWFVVFSEEQNEFGKGDRVAGFKIDVGIIQRGIDYYKVRIANSCQNIYV